MLRHVFLLGLMLLSAGCAGHKYMRLTGDQITVGQQTVEGVKRILGKPYQEGTLLQNGQTIKSLTYARGYASFKPLVGGVVPMRVQSFFFHKGLLVGHLYTSTQEGDVTNFETDQLDQIVENKTTIDEALQVLGPASGEYIYPMVKEENSKQLIYFYCQKKTNFIKPELSLKLLKLTYGANRVIAKVEYVESGKI